MRYTFGMTNEEQPVKILDSTDIDGDTLEMLGLDNTGRFESYTWEDVARRAIELLKERSA